MPSQVQSDVLNLLALSDKQPSKRYSFYSDPQTKRLHFWSIKQQMFGICNLVFDLINLSINLSTNRCSPTKDRWLNRRIDTRASLDGHTDTCTHTHAHTHTHTVVSTTVGWHDYWWLCCSSLYPSSKSYQIMPKCPRAKEEEIKGLLWACIWSYRNYKGGRADRQADRQPDSKPSLCI